MKILLLGAHLDDSELGCGGSIHKAIQQGHEVSVRILTDWNLPEAVLNAMNASNILGVKDFGVSDFPMREFYSVRSKILDYLLFLRNTINPDLVYTHSTGHNHQDHEVVSQESIRIFKHSSILGYNLPWNNIKSTTHQCFNEISQDNLEAKIQAIQCYTTEAHRTYMSPEYHKALAIIEGQKIGVKYAESFEVIRWKM